MSQSDVTSLSRESVPEEAYRQAMQSSAAEPPGQQYGEALQQLRAEYLDGLYGLIGPANLQRYLHLHERRVRNMLKLRETTPATPDGARILAERRAHNIAESYKLFQRSGIDIDQLTRLRQQHTAALCAIFPDRPGASATQAEGAMPLGGGGGAIDLEAPYLEKQCTEYAWSNRGPDHYGLTRSCDNVTGRMEHDSWMRVYDASNHDEVYMESVHQVGSLACVPHGCTSLWLTAVFANERSESRGSWDEECGWSRLRFMQWLSARLTVKRVWPAGSSEMRETTVRGALGGTGAQQFIWDDAWIHIGEGTICSVDADLFQAGEQVCSDPLFFAGPYAEGDYLGVWAGLRCGHCAWIDDVSLTDDLSYHLRLDKIVVIFA